MPGAFPWNDIAVIIVDVFAHLDQPAKTVHIVYVDFFGRYMFAFPGKGACRLPVRVGRKLDYSPCPLHLLHSACFGIVYDTDVRVVFFFDTGNICKGAVICVIAARHAAVRMICADSVRRAVDSSLRPVIFAGMRALFTVPGNSIAGYFVGEAFRNQKVRIGLAVFPCAGFFYGHLGYRRDSEIPGKIF